MVPERLVPAIRERLFDLGDCTSPFSAAVLANFMELGGLRRQIATIQRVYADRRRALTAACRRLSPAFEVIGISAGLHLVLAAQSDRFDDVMIVDRLAGHGLACAPLSYFYDRPTPQGQLRGLVCSYSRLPASRAAAAVAIIDAVIASAVLA